MCPVWDKEIVRSTNGSDLSGKPTHRHNCIRAVDDAMRYPEKELFLL
jgi:hypothetical protein